MRECDPVKENRSANQNAALSPGQRVELTTVGVAQGGWCVARPPGMPVVFVRHALPGERVIVNVTEVTSRFARADAVEVLDAAPDRVEPPCPYARPGACGGCDWQHATLPAQRGLKAEVIREQFARLAGLELPVTVEPLPAESEPDASGLGWRTRVQFAVRHDGTAGLRAHRSHRVVPIADCLIAHQAIRSLDVPGHSWPKAESVEALAGAADTRAVIVRTAGRPGAGTTSRYLHIEAEAVYSSYRGRLTPAKGRPWLRQHAAGRDWRVSLGAFWQVHPDAADVLSGAVLAALRPRAGDVALDLYCGAGLFTGALAEAVGADGAVAGVESDPAAVRDARHNLRETPWARVRAGDAAGGLRSDARLAVVDPPRSGLGRAVIANLPDRLERLAYVSCDPATLARDVGLLMARGWSVDGLRAFDAFPMTHHAECVATLCRG